MRGLSSFSRDTALRRGSSQYLWKKRDHLDRAAESKPPFSRVHSEGEFQHTLLKIEKRDGHGLLLLPQWHALLRVPEHINLALVRYEE